MKLYYVNADVDGYRYFAKLADARKLANDAAKKSYDDIHVELVETDTNKRNILRILNDVGGFQRLVKISYIAKAKLKK